MNTQRCTFFGVVSAALLVAACATTDSPRATRAVASPSAELERILPGLIEEADIPGLSVTLIEGGKPSWQGAFGVGNTETGEAVTPETVFEAASLSKPVFAYGVLRLAERGGIDLDTPLWDILPYDRLEHDERARAITPRIVLSHQSGLPNWGGTPLEMSFAPGERWSYSGEGFVYLQKTVEKLTGLGLDAFARREVFEPLGMTRSSFVLPEDRPTAAPHDHLGDPRPKNQPDANAASSLHTTAGDYARFVAAMLAPPPAERDLVRRMLEPQTQVRNWGTAEPAPHLYWGLGWGLQDRDVQDSGPEQAFWHWGDNQTFRCYVLGDPATGDGLVYFTNSENGLSIAGKLASTVFPGRQQHAVEWLDYEAYDDPGRRLVLGLERAFLDQGREKGLALFERLGREHNDTMDVAIAGRVAQTLADRDRREDALALLEANVARFPEDPEALHAMGQGMLEGGRLERALETYRKILELQPDDERAPARIAWAELGLGESVEVSPETLARYAGSYGPRQVTLEEGRLRYVRRGRDTHYWLTPITEDTFALEGLPWFRLRFVRGEDGEVVKVEGLYADGRSDESIRE